MSILKCQTKILRTGKFFSICIMLICSFFANGDNGEDPEELAKTFLTISKNYTEIEPVIDIIIKNRSTFDALPSIMPINPSDRPVITSSFGNRKDPITGNIRYHKGIDLKAGYGVMIYATANGIVSVTEIRGGYGKCIIIQHPFGFSTLYAHLSEYYVTKGEHVRKGQIIGFLGDTGRTTGAHLHYEVKKNNKNDNPLNYFL